ncbi:MAG TPA: CbiX/SirB N-terminal domain-containing protein [Aeromicrobium sp.]|nr:CbiX/SirB N-terminal domain-containing protein [Aeromicrobium sp.]
MSESLPALVACSHGTRSAAGAAAVAALVSAVRDRLGSVEVIDTFVDVQQPALGEVLGQVGRREAIVVPLLLSAGYHVHHDIADAVDRNPSHRATDPLGPNSALVEILVERLIESGMSGADTVVLGASASSDQVAVESMNQVASALSERLGRLVPLGHVGHCGTALADVVAAAREPGRRVLLASYLLAPGHFHDALKNVGADLVTAPLLDERLPDERLVDLVVQRYQNAADFGFAAAV